MCLGCLLPIHIPEPEPLCIRASGSASYSWFYVSHISDPEPACARVCVRVRVWPRMWALHPEPEPMLVLFRAQPCARGILPVLYYMQSRISIMHSGLK